MAVTRCCPPSDTRRSTSAVQRCDRQEQGALNGLYYVLAVFVLGTRTATERVLWYLQLPEFDEIEPSNPASTSSTSSRPGESLALSGNKNDFPEVLPAVEIRVCVARLGKKERPIDWHGDRPVKH